MNAAKSITSKKPLNSAPFTLKSFKFKDQTLESVRPFLPLELPIDSLQHTVQTSRQ